MGGRGPKKPVIHLLAVAGSCRRLLAHLDCANTAELVHLVQRAVGDDYEVTATASLVEAAEDDARGGRTDDAARARDIQRVFADDRVAAAVALRGGAWLTRILPRIDFRVLERRRRRFALFGFSELSPLLNVAAGYERVVAYHDLCPAYLLPGMTGHALRRGPALYAGDTESVTQWHSFARGWAAARFRPEFCAFFSDVARMIRGLASTRPVSGRWFHVKHATRRPVILAGGNLTTIVTLLGTDYRDALHPDGRWLLLEDVRESPDRVDRLLCHFSLSGWLRRYDGIVLGTFHDAAGDRTDAVLACLTRHLGRTRPPIVITGDVGHTWPMSPVPLGRPFVWETARDGRVTARMPWADWRIE